MGPHLRRRGFLALGGLATVAACSGGPAWDDARGRLRIATGNRGAVFDRYGTALAAEAEVLMPDVDASIVLSRGSVENVRLLLDGRADVAFCLGDTARDAYEGSAPFDAPAGLVAVCRLYDSFLQVLVPDDSPVRSIADLRGRRLSAGQVGSGTRLVVERCLAAVGLAGDVTLLDVDLETSAAALRTGRVDALAFVSGFPVPSLVALGRVLPLRGVDLADVLDRLATGQDGDEYVAGPLPAGPYGLPTTVETVSVKTSMLARPDLDDALVQGFASVVFDRQEALARRVPDVRQPTLAAAMFTQPIPLHPGALRFLRRRYDLEG
jgi:TRAP transporter TAXI family solute receptor